MSQSDTLHLAQEFLGRMGSGAEPAEIAKLFSENMQWEIAGDTGVLCWIAQKSGRAAITDFVNDSRAMIERISFEVQGVSRIYERVRHLRQGVGYSRELPKDWRGAGVVRETASGSES